MSKKRYNYLLIWIFLTSIALITTTYAWFSANRVVTINTLNIHVEADGGLEISSDAVDWKSILDLTDLQAARDNYPTSLNQVPNILTPVSTGGDIDNGLLTLFHGMATNDAADYVLTSTRSLETEGFGDESDGNFIAFDIFLKTESPKTIYLTPDAGVRYNGVTNAGIENAFRIAFLDEGTLDTAAAASSVQALRGATAPNIWEPNYDVHTAEAVAHAFDVYGITTTQAGAARLNYDGLIGEIPSATRIRVNDANAANYPQYFRPVTVAYSTVANFTTNVELFDLNPGVTKLRIYMWIEGQDVDCENNASIGDVNVDLQLTVNPN